MIFIQSDGIEPVQIKHLSQPFGQIHVLYDEGGEFGGGCGFVFQSKHHDAFIEDEHLERDRKIPGDAHFLSGFGKSSTAAAS